MHALDAHSLHSCCPREMENNCSSCTCVATVGSSTTSIQTQVDTERRYITKLEREKASDANAKEATKKLVATTAQLAMLNECLIAMSSHPVAMPAPADGTSTSSHGGVHAGLHGGAGTAAKGTAHKEAATWQPKNTLVRETLRGIGPGGPRLPLQDANR